MGDYLSELATKNIGTADVIQPRRAARFEPRGAQTEPLFFQSESFDLEPSFEDEGGAIKQNPRAHRTRLSRKDESGPGRDDSDEQISAAWPVSPAKLYSSITKKIDERVSTQSKMIEEMREMANGNFVSRPASSTIVSSENLLPTPRRDTHEETKMTIETASIQPRFESKAGELKMPKTKIAEPPVVERKIVRTHTPIVIKPRVSKAENHFEEAMNKQTKILPPREKISKQIAENAQASNAPVINVTIGRVEVRAVTSPAPGKETSPKPPTLSLDEYLRQRRSRGGRR